MSSHRSLRTALAALVALAVAGGLVHVLVAQGGQPGPTDPLLRLKWFDNHVALKQKSPFKDLAWQFVGPTNVSGRAIDVAVASPRGKYYTI